MCSTLWFVEFEIAIFFIIPESGVPPVPLSMKSKLQIARRSSPLASESVVEIYGSGFSQKKKKENMSAS